MKTVCMCGSFRHYDEMLALRAVLLASGASCEWPTFDHRRDPKTMTGEEAKAAILSHLERMDRADLILIYNPDGYVGNSVVMEIGYAYAQRKPLYALMPIQDPFLVRELGVVISVLAEPVFTGMAIYNAANPSRGQVTFTYGPDGRLLDYGSPPSYGPPEDAVEPPSVGAFRRSCWFSDLAEPPEVDTRTEEAETGKAAYVECVALRLAIWGID